MGIWVWDWVLWDIGLGLGFMGYRFGIGFMGCRFGIGFYMDFLPNIYGPHDPYMDFPPELCEPYGPYMIFLPEITDRTVHI